MALAQKTIPTYDANGLLEKCIRDGTPLKGWHEAGTRGAYTYMQTRCTSCTYAYHKSGRKTYISERPTKERDTGIGLKCVDCDSEIQGKGMIFSILDVKMGSMWAGGGETTQVIIPYCPKCEKEPSGDYGGELHYNPSDEEEAAVIRNMRR